MGAKLATVADGGRHADGRRRSEKADAAIRKRSADPGHDPRADLGNRHNSGAFANPATGDPGTRLADRREPCDPALAARAPPAHQGRVQVPAAPGRVHGQAFEAVAVRTAGRLKLVTHCRNVAAASAVCAARICGLSIVQCRSARTGLRARLGDVRLCRAERAARSPRGRLFPRGPATMRRSRNGLAEVRTTGAALAVAARPGGGGARGDVRIYDRQPRLVDAGGPGRATPAATISG